MHALAGHESLSHALAGAHARDTLPACLLFHGTPGVGKQRLALWVAQLLLCEDPTAQGPCDSCKSCRMEASLEHPDLHWYFPLPRPKGASTPEKLKRALEQARFDQLGEWRDQPLRPSVTSSDPTGLYLAIARSIRSRALKRPAMGSRQIFVIGEAENLVPQEASQEAANALLKLLEEPPRGTYLILTSNQPERLLHTIRSRTLPIHVPPLSRERVRDFLVDEAGVTPEEANRAAALSNGSIGRALGFVSSEGTKGPLEAIRQDAFRLLRAATAKNPGPGYQQALSTPAAGARALLPLLEFLESALRDLAAVANKTPEAVDSSDALDFLGRLVQNHGLHPSFMAESLMHIDEAKVMAAGNVNPQLVIAGLTLDLRSTLLRTESR